MNQEETRQLKITAYRDKSGNPTCAVDFSNGKVCGFYRSGKLFGCWETCVFAENSQSLERRNDGKGTLIPLKNCPVWA